MRRLEAGWHQFARQRSPRRSTRLLLRHRPRPAFGITVGIALLGLGAQPGPGLVGWVPQRQRMRLANLAGRGLAPPAPSAVSGGAALIHDCSGAAVVWQLLGLKTGRGGAGHRHPPCRPGGPGGGSDLSILGHRPPTGPRSGGARPAPALLNRPGRPCCPGPSANGGYRLECGPAQCRTSARVFGLGGLGTELRPEPAVVCNSQRALDRPWLLLAVNAVARSLLRARAHVGMPEAGS